MLWKPITYEELKGILSLIAEMKKAAEPTVFIIEKNWYLRIRRYVIVALNKPDIPKHLITVKHTPLKKMKLEVAKIMEKYTTHDYRVVRRPNGVPKISHEEVPPPENSVMFPR